MALALSCTTPLPIEQEPADIAVPSPLPEWAQANEPSVVSVSVAARFSSGATRYEKRAADPVLEQLRLAAQARQSALDEASGLVEAGVAEQERLAGTQRLVLQSSLNGEELPPSLEVFRQVAHQPTLPQYRTGTCWSFAATSFFESESARLTGRMPSLSPMFSVYHEYLDKVSYWVEQRGQSAFGEGSQLGALLRTWPRYGVVALENYRGVTDASGMHDHAQLLAELEAMLQMLKAQRLWERDLALGLARVILQRTMGEPPRSLVFEGRILSPQQYVSQGLGLDMGAYRQFVSTARHPFGTWSEFEVPDNWWHDDGYCNVSLEDFAAITRNALENGFSVGLALDTSEPGRDVENDVMFVPEFDIPASHLNQMAREYRLFAQVTSDDHGVHLVGIAEHAGQLWYLAKDSGRGGFGGRFPGYFMIREDYLRLKGLALLVHRDGLQQARAYCGER